MVMMLVAVSSADLSVTDHLRGWIDGAAAQLGWGSNSASEAVTNHGRSLAAAGESDRALIINNASIPAWRGRFDTQFGLAYYAPALAVQTCKTGRATNCNGVASLPSLSYPYMQWMPDPTTNTSQPVMKVWYPAGSWSPTSSFPGGTLFYGYPYKDFPDAGPDPFSTVGASLEYEVYFPAGFNFVKGEAQTRIELNGTRIQAFSYSANSNLWHNFLQFERELSC